MVDEEQIVVFDDAPTFVAPFRRAQDPCFGRVAWPSFEAECAIEVIEVGADLPGKAPTCRAVHDSCVEGERLHGVRFATCGQHPRVSRRIEELAQRRRGLESMRPSGRLFEDAEYRSALCARPLEERLDGMGIRIERASV